MAQISAELAHLAIGVEAVAVPCRDSSNGEGMPKIVDSRPTSIPAESLRLAQTECLRDNGEVVSGLAFPQPMPVVIAEERARRMARAVARARDDRCGAG